MKIRINAARLLIRLGRFIQSLALMVMRPDDLAEYTKRAYSHIGNIEVWSRKELVDSGLKEDEKTILENLPLQTGKILLLGVGGGRDAIPLLRMGFEVTGVDFIEEMVKRAKENAARFGFKMEGVVQEISTLEILMSHFDAVWFSLPVYSYVPTRKRRVALLKKIWGVLKPGGYSVCQFYCGKFVSFSPKVEFSRKVVALLTLGNFWYEKGDTLFGNEEFVHFFSSESELKEEFEEGGFGIIHLSMPRGGGIEGRAILKKKDIRKDAYIN